MAKTINNVVFTLIAFFVTHLVILDVALLNHLFGLLQLVFADFDPLLVDHVLGLQDLNI